MFLFQPNIGKDDNIGLAERDSAVTTIKAMHRFYNYNPETLAAAVSYLDRFISKVKVFFLLIDSILSQNINDIKQSTRKHKLK